MPQNMIYLFIGHLGIGLTKNYAQIGLVIVDTSLRELKKNGNNQKETIEKIPNIEFVRKP